jgi:hypothetical protein
MNIKIKQVGQKKIIEEIRKVTGYPNDFILNEIVSPIFMEYFHYCNKYLKNFLVKAGFTKDFKIIILWQDKASSLANVNKNEVRMALKNNKPFIMHMSLYHCMISIKNFINIITSKRHDKPIIVAGNFNNDMMDAIVHETIHLTQLILKTTSLGNRVIAGLDKDIRSNNQLILEFIEIINDVHSYNQEFLRTIKLEGEAKYFGKMYSYFSNLRPSLGNNYASIDIKKSIIGVRNDEAKAKLTEAINVMEPVLKKHIIEMKSFIVNLKVVYELVKDITNILLDFQNDFIQGESEVIKNKDIYQQKERILHLNVKELSATVPRIEISADLSKFVNYEAGHLHKLGYIIVYALKKAKIYRYDMNDKTLLNKFMGIENIKEIRNIIILIKELVKTVNDVEDIFNENSRLIPKDELAMKRFNELIHKE